MSTTTIVTTANWYIYYDLYAALPADNLYTQ